MKAPADIDDYEEMIDIVNTETSIGYQEVKSIIGEVFITMTTEGEVMTDIDNFAEIVRNASYKEAFERHRARDERESEDAVRREKGGILKKKFPNHSGRWKAKCQATYCGFDSHENNSKVDNVICPECGRKLWIDPLQ